MFRRFPVGLVDLTLVFPFVVTGIGSPWNQVSGTDVEERTSSDYTGHTYVSSTFTKGERALLSITDNSSSSDVRESSTSSIKIDLLWDFLPNWIERASVGEVYLQL